MSNGAEGADLEPQAHRARPLTGRSVSERLTIAAGGQFNWAISTTWGVLQPNARLEWQDQTAGDSNVVQANFGNATPQSVQIAGQDKSYGVRSVGVQAILPNSVRAHFSFESPFGKCGYSG